MIEVVPMKHTDEAPVVVEMTQRTESGRAAMVERLTLVDALHVHDQLGEAIRRTEVLRKRDAEQPA
jgi:hypothetical protein